MHCSRGIRKIALEIPYSLVGDAREVSRKAKAIAERFYNAPSSNKTLFEFCCTPEFILNQYPDAGTLYVNDKKLDKEIHFRPYALSEQIKNISNRTGNKQIWGRFFDYLIESPSLLLVILTQEFVFPIGSIDQVRYQKMFQRILLYWDTYSAYSTFLDDRSFLGGGVKSTRQQAFPSIYLIPAMLEGGVPASFFKNYSGVPSAEVSRQLIRQYCVPPE